MSIDAVQDSNEALYEFSIYPFSTDVVFQEGLHSIVSSAHGRSQEELDNVIGQAKVFYFNRTTGRQVTWENYVEWRKSHPLPFPSAPVDTPRETTPTPPESQPVPVPLESTSLTFQQITELIKAGRTELIPNNKVIPEALNPDVPSESKAPARKKPWEAGDSSVATLDVQTQ